MSTTCVGCKNIKIGGFGAIYEEIKVSFFLEKLIKSLINAIEHKKKENFFPEIFRFSTFLYMGKFSKNKIKPGTSRV
jgi:hypothetical protein